MGKKEYEVPDENSNGIEIDECKTEEPTELVTERNSIMQKALDASNKASQNMVKRELWRNPPSLYYKGETVLIRKWSGFQLIEHFNCQFVFFT